jgi:predicted dehydrogenase
MSAPKPDNRLLRWGLLGTARINRVLIPPLQASRRNQLVAVASRSIEKAKAYAREKNIPRAFGSYEKMLADPEIEVIYNSLPNSLHAEWSIKAARAGKHVLCEKPLALTTGEVEAMASAAQENGVVLAEAFMYRHHPQTLRVKGLVDAGEIGEVWLVRGSFTFSISREQDIRLNPALGGGSLWDIGCYPISYARTIYGRAPQIAFGWGRTGASGVEESFAGSLCFPGNEYAQFDSGFRTPYRSEFEILGTKGSIIIPNPYKPGKDETISLKKNGQAEEIKIAGQELYLGEVEDMADAILDAKPPRISLRDSWENVQTIQALIESARSGLPVRLEGYANASKE